MARDNTVRFQLHTLQLLPGPEHPSYAGAAVEVLEGLDGRLSVRHEGRIPAQEAPPSPVFLRNGHRLSATVPAAPSGANGLGERWTAALNSDTQCPKITPPLTIAAFAEEMSDFLKTSELTETKAFVHSFVKEVVVKPGRAAIVYSIPTPDDSPMGGADAAEIALNGRVMNSVRHGGPKWTVDGTVFEMWLGRPTVPAST